MTDIPERRRQTERVNARALATLVAVGTEYAVFTRNMSIGGIFLEASLDLPFDTPVELRLDLDLVKEKVTVTGRVRWVEKTPAGVSGLGIQFDGLAPKGVWALNRYLAEIRKRE